MGTSSLVFPLLACLDQRCTNFWIMRIKHQPLFRYDSLIELFFLINKKLWIAVIPHRQRQVHPRGTGNQVAGKEDGLPLTAKHCVHLPGSMTVAIDKTNAVGEFTGKMITFNYRESIRRPQLFD